MPFEGEPRLPRFQMARIEWYWDTPSDPNPRLVPVNPLCSEHRTMDSRVKANVMTNYTGKELEQSSGSTSTSVEVVEYTQGGIVPSLTRPLIVSAPRGNQFPRSPPQTRLQDTPTRVRNLRNIFAVPAPEQEPARRLGEQEARPPAGDGDRADPGEKTDERLSIFWEGEPAATSALRRASFLLLRDCRERGGDTSAAHP